MFGCNTGLHGSVAETTCLAILQDGCLDQLKQVNPFCLLPPTLLSSPPHPWVTVRLSVSESLRTMQHWVCTGGKPCQLQWWWCGLTQVHSDREDVEPSPVSMDPTSHAALWPRLLPALSHSRHFYRRVNVSLSCQKARLTRCIRIYTPCVSSTEHFLQVLVWLFNNINEFWLHYLRLDNQPSLLQLPQDWRN